MPRYEKRPGTPLGRGYRSGLSHQAAKWALQRLVEILGPRLRPLRSPGRMARRDEKGATPMEPQPLTDIEIVNR